MSIIAIITARGGSKRIPRKNIKNFMGKPMIAYAIEAALKSQIFDEVMVSTDDNEIAEISRKYGASVPFMRSEQTSNDFATTFDVLDEVINEYKKQGKIFEKLCCIYPCVPFLKSSTLVGANELFVDCNGVMPVCKYSVPIEWALKVENGELTAEHPDLRKVRSQDLTPKYFDVGMFYFCKTEKLYEHNSLTPSKLKPYIMDESEMQDIDTPEDWKMAEMKFSILNNKL